MFLGPMPHLDPKGEGKHSMAAKRRSCPGVGSDASRDPRVIWRKLDCLKPSLQTMRLNIRRKDARNRRHDLRRHPTAAAATPGRGAMPSEGIQGDEQDA